MLRDRATRGPGRLRDDAGVQLICPTCQIAFQSIRAGDGLLLCMGLFSIFLVGSQKPRQPGGSGWLFLLLEHDPEECVAAFP